MQVDDMHASVYVMLYLYMFSLTPQFRSCR